VRGGGFGDIFRPGLENLLVSGVATLGGTITYESRPCRGIVDAFVGLEELRC
jgi:hypothetical protein